MIIFLKLFSPPALIATGIPIGVPTTIRLLIGLRQPPLKYVMVLRGMSSAYPCHYEHEEVYCGCQSNISNQKTCNMLLYMHMCCS